MGKVASWDLGYSGAERAASIAFPQHLVAKLSAYPAIADDSSRRASSMSVGRSMMISVRFKSFPAVHALLILMVLKGACVTSRG